MDVKKCIICDSDKDLNTSLNVTVDDKKHTVYLCDEHAEDTTPKQAKEALSNKIEKLKAVIAEARAMGLTVSNPFEDNKLMIVEEPEKAPTPVRQNLEPEGEQAENDATEKKKIQKLPNFKSQSGSVGGAQLAQHQSIPVDAEINRIISENKDKLVNTVMPETTESEAQVLTTSTRGQIVVPKTLVGNTGTTNIKMASSSDRELQDRFKSEAHNSMESDQDSLRSKPSYAKDTDVQCTFCRGTGISRMGRSACAKCGGSGIISL